MSTIEKPSSGDQPVHPQYQSSEHKTEKKIENEVFTLSIQTAPTVSIPSSKEVPKGPPIENMIDSVVHDHPSLDPHFVCSKKNFLEQLPFIESLVDASYIFDTASFLSAKSPKSNDQLLNTAKNAFQEKAKILSQTESIPLLDAYKLLVGILDQYDSEQSKAYIETKTNPKSTFCLRNALLLASIESGASLDSWMVYTKGNKPTGSHLWPFLDNWKNWVPEAQGAMAKLSEVNRVQAKKLAEKNPENRVVLLKGGFGAGKTRLAKQLFQSKGGVIAPDRAKAVVRKSLPKVPHAAAHIQGSQAAYSFFDALIKEQSGTVVYDSSLSRATDVEAYLGKCKKSGRKMVIYDVARNDMARTLAVLARNVSGEDPRIPPDVIIQSAIQDKMNRTACMQVVLNDTTEDAALRPEYHFLSGDAKGWNTEEVMVLTSKNDISMTQKAFERTPLEFISYDLVQGKFVLNTSEEELRTYFTETFKKTVRETLESISTEEKTLLEPIFKGRTLSFKGNTQSFLSPEELYTALDEEMKKALPKEAFMEACKGLDLDILSQKIKEQGFISYLDLPLRNALLIHQHLLQDPWS